MVVGPAARDVVEPIDRSASRRSSHVIGAGFAPEGGLQPRRPARRRPGPDRASATTTTWRCSSSPAGRPARPRRPCSPTATCARTSARCCRRPPGRSRRSGRRRRVRRAAALPHLRAQRGARAHPVAGARSCWSSGSIRRLGDRVDPEAPASRSSPGRPPCGRRGPASPTSPTDSFAVGPSGRLGRGAAARRDGQRGSRSASASTLAEGYGLTEASPVVTSSVRERRARPGRSASRCRASRSDSSTTAANDVAGR